VKKILLVGGDSRLSKNFMTKYKHYKNIKIFKTTRKLYKKNSIFLDFLNLSQFKNYKGFDSVVIVGGVVDYQECENNYNYAKKVNCINIPLLAKNFLKMGSHVIFISTNTVFKSKKKIPNERTRTCPGFKYAKMKDIAEKKILVLKKRYKKVTILRLTKNLDRNTSPIKKWVTDLKRNKHITAFKDLYFAPILYEQSSKIIYKIIKNKCYGIVHLSGTRDISYCEFAKLLIKKLGKNSQLLNCLNSTDMNIKLIYNHNITALNMKFTKKKLNFNPIELNKVISYLINKK